MKYIVELKYTNPSHEHVSLRRRVESTSRLVEAANEQEAVFRATRQQKALGFMIKEAKATVVQEATKKVDFVKFGKDILAQRLEEGFDTDPKDIAAYLVNRHGKGKVTMDHIEAYERGRDSHRPIEKNAVMQHVKKMSEEVEQVDEASHVAYLKPKAGAPSDVKDHFDLPVHSDSKKDAHSKFAKVFGSNMAKHYEVVHVKPKAVKEEVEQIDELKKSTLASYVNKAANQVRAKTGIAASFETQGVRKRNPEQKAAYMGLAKDFRKGTKKRLAGIEKATTKLAKEEVETVDEADVTKDLRTSMKMMDLRHGVDSDKRVSGYKMSAVVRSAQKKFDAQSKGQGKMRPQAGTLPAKKISEDVELQYIEEKLTAADPASKWISDFVASDNPKFAGKSKKERIQMALGAHYAAKRAKNEEVVDEAKKTEQKKEDGKKAEGRENVLQGKVNKINMEPKLDHTVGGVK